MTTIIKFHNLKAIAQSTESLSGSQAVASPYEDGCYRWVQRTLYKFHDRKLGKQVKDVLIRYLMKIIDCSREQITRLITQYYKTK